MFFDDIKNIYSKRRHVPETLDMQFGINATKWLSYDVDNLPVLRKNVDYIFYLQPIYYWALLFFTIPKKFKAPFLEKVAKEPKKKEDKVLEKIKYVMGWSSRELAINKRYIDTLDRKKLKQELGVK